MSQQTDWIVPNEKPFCEFTSFQHWVNHARSWLGGVNDSVGRYKRAERTVCIDAKGRVCANGADFARARDEGAFPVKAYLR